MVGQHSTLSAGGVQGRTRRQPPGATNEERGRARFPFTIMQSCSRPASDRCRGGQPLEATNEVRGRARFPSTTTQSCSRPSLDDCREAGGGLWVSDKSAGRARFPFTIMQSCSRPASDRCRRGQPLEATHEVRGRARFPSTATQSCSRPARDDCREAGGGPWVSDKSALLHPTLIARGARGGPERGARSSMISQACSHAADQPVITTGEACRWKLPTRSAAERGFLLQLFSHAADPPAMTAGARGGDLGLTVHALSYIQH